VSTVDSRAVGRGALAGLLVIVPLTALRAVLDHQVDRFDSSGWVPLFAIALFLAYVIAGVVAGRRTPEAPLSNGLLAGVGAFLLWLPLRVLIWAGRGEAQGLFSGPDPVFTAAQLFGQILFAAVFGVIGGLIGARQTRRTRAVDRPLDS
jgi:putative membrane protein (TIGR04086 family)